MKKFWEKNKRAALVGIGIFLLAAFLRLYKLSSLPVFADEAIYVRWAQVMRADSTLRFLPLSDGKQPLFMWVTIPFLKIISNPVIAGRMVSALCGLGSLIGVFVLTFYLFKSRKVAFIAALIYAISPFSIFFDRMALADAMLAMFGVWTLVFAVFTAKTLRLDTAMLTGFALGGALLTKSPASFFALLLPTTIILVKWPKKNKAIHLGKLLFLWGVTLIIAYGFYNILRLGPEFHMIAIRNKDYIYPINHLLTNPLDPFLPYVDRSIEWLWALGPSVLLILVAGGVILNFKKRPKEMILLAGWGIGPMLVQAEFAKVFTARYIFFVLPYLFVLAASLFLIKKERLKRFFVLGLIIFVFHSLTIGYLFLTDIETTPLPRSERSGYLEEWTSGYGIYEVSELIREEWERKPEGQIIVGTEGYFGTLPNALQAYLNDIKEVIVIGVGLTVDDIPEPLIESERAGNRTYLVINSTRFEGDLEKVDLEILAAYPKAVRPDGSREALLFFRVGK